MKQVLVALVEDKPGVLNRIASLFRRRNFNIESLVVGPCEVPHASRLTIVTGEEESLRRNIIKQNLLKLINVIDVQDVTDLPCVIREHALIKVRAIPATVRKLRTLIDEHHAHIIDETRTTLIVEVTDESGQIDALIELLEPFGVLEINRAGKVAMIRGAGNSPIRNNEIGKYNGRPLKDSPKSI